MARIGEFWLERPIAEDWRYRWHVWRWPERCAEAALPIGELAHGTDGWSWAMRWWSGRAPGVILPDGVFPTRAAALAGVIVGKG